MNFNAMGSESKCNSTSLHFILAAIIKQTLLAIWLITVKISNPLCEILYYIYIYISLTHTFYIHTFYTYIKKIKIAVKGKCHLPETTNTLTD